MLRLEDLLLANLVVRRGLASPPEVQAALAALDRAPQRADLIAALAARGGPLGQPQVRSEAIAGVKRFVVGRAEQIMASRLRAANVLPPAALDELVARQRAEGFAWLLADRLTHEGRLDAGRRAALEQEVARDLAEYGASLVARHRASAFAETVSVAPTAAGLPQVSLSTSSEVFRALDPQPPQPPQGGDGDEPTLRMDPPAPAALSDSSDDELTLRIPPPPAHLIRQGGRPTPVPVPAPALPGARPGPAGAFHANNSGTSRSALPPQPPALTPEQLGATVKFPGHGPAPSSLEPSDATVRLGDVGQAQGSPAASAVKKKLPAGPLSEGMVLAGKLEVLGELGRGGMGIVYRARSRDSGNEVALKVVPSQGAATKEILPRFKREIMTASRVKHLNVCAVVDSGEAQGLAYMAMELVGGGDLRELLDREAPLATDRAVALLEQILRGLSACHDAKVIHRDLKPDNVRITRVAGREVAKIVDFGIARLSDAAAAGGEEVFMTMKGVLSGTPSYVAPELILDEELVSARADVYAVGVIFYELLTGKLPFPAKTLREILKESVERAPTPLAEALPNHTVPPAIERVLFRMLEKDPLVRYGTPQEVLTALDEARNPRPASEGKPGFTARLVRRITKLFGRA